MSNLQDLQPTARQNIIDLVEASGIDVTPWQFTQDGRRVAHPPSNGRFCYDWEFSEGERKFTFCLWFSDCEEDASGIFQRGNMRVAIRSGQLSGPRQRRAEAFDTGVQKAFFKKVPVRVVVVDGYPRQLEDDEASKVATRLLDENWWSISSYDYKTGDFVFRRLEAVAGEDAWEEDFQLAQDIADIEAQTNVPATVREALVQARVGQGEFRRKLLARWGNSCAVTGCNLKEVLRASHCKPWRASDNVERLNAANGLLLSANLDALFDRYLIAFEGDGRMLISDRISDDHRTLLSLGGRLRLAPTEEEQTFLRIHREEFMAQSRTRASAAAAVE